MIPRMEIHRFPWEAIFLGVAKFLKAFGLIPGAAAAIGVRRRYQKWRQRKAMAGWPSTEATILSGEIHGNGPRNFWAEIVYSYHVGQYRAGRYVRYFRKEGQADEFVRRTKEKRIQVHYDQLDPDRSVILDRDIELAAPLVLDLS
jgi:Protein of unknown function (DUF3592)